MSDSASPVSVQVKSPYTVHKFSVEMLLSETVLALKGKIAASYPGNPSTDQQRLIFAGKLCHNEATLADTFRQQDADGSYVVHLIVPNEVQQQIASEIDGLSKDSDPPGSQASSVRPSAQEATLLGVASQPSSRGSQPSAPASQPPLRTSQPSGSATQPGSSSQASATAAPTEHPSRPTETHGFPQTNPQPPAFYHPMNPPLGGSALPFHMYHPSQMYYQQPPNPVLRQRTLQQRGNRASQDPQVTFADFHQRVLDMSTHISRQRGPGAQTLHSSAHLSQTFHPSSHMLHPGSQPGLGVDVHQALYHQSIMQQQQQMFAHQQMFYAHYHQLLQQQAHPETTSLQQPSDAPGGEPTTDAPPAGQENGVPAVNNAQVNREFVFVIDFKLILKLAFVIYVLGHDGNKLRLGFLCVMALVYYFYSTGYISVFGYRANHPQRNNAPQRPEDAAANTGGRRFDVNDFGRIPNQEQENHFLTDTLCLIKSFVLSIVPQWEVQQREVAVQPADDAPAPVQG